MKESDLVRQILEYLRAIGAVAGKVKVMGVMRHGRYCIDPMVFRGYPDVCVFHRNKMYYIEAKIKGNYQSPEQKVFQELCRTANIPYILAYTVEDVVSVIS
jgi:hypothetical protein